MLKSRKGKVLLPPLNGGAATPSEKAEGTIDTLLANAEDCLEIDEEARKLQQMREDAKELNRSAEANLKALETALSKLKEAKTAIENATNNATKIVDQVNDAVDNAKNMTIKVGVSDETCKKLGEQHNAYLKKENTILENHRQKTKNQLEEHREKMRKIAESSGGFYLTGWMAKLAIGSYIFLCIYYCITLCWFASR